MRKQIFWLTGLPCSGKTTIAKELARHTNAEILDGDDIRKIANNNDFTEEGRRKHMLAVAEFANLLSKYTNVIVALVSPIKSIREEIKNKYPNLTEIYVMCDLEECKRRDVKGMYAKALNGEIKDFTGIDAPYEEPDLIGKNKSTFVDAETLDVEQCVDIILSRHYQPKKYSLFIGRWQPLHDGHKALFDVIRKEGKNILVGIRDTQIDENNPLSVSERVAMIQKELPHVDITVIPDIEEIVIGRKVGYNIREVKLDKDTEAISATEIRKQWSNKKTS